MADEARIVASLYIKSGNLEYRSYPTSFTTDVSGAKGPSPGVVAVPVTGVNYDLSQLTVPGWCIIRNLDSTNKVHWGTYAAELFVPIGEVGPGEFCLFKFSSFFGHTLEATGTATSGIATEYLHMIAENDSCDVVVEAFEA